MITNKGNSEGLFRGGFMNSGSPLTTGSILNGQFYYDQAVNATGCQGAVDTLACLRLAPYSVLKVTYPVFEFRSQLLIKYARILSINNLEFSLIKLFEMLIFQGLMELSSRMMDQN